MGRHRVEVQAKKLARDSAISVHYRTGPYSGVIRFYADGSVNYATLQEVGRKKGVSVKSTDELPQGVYRAACRAIKGLVKPPVRILPPISEELLTHIRSGEPQRFYRYLMDFSISGLKNLLQRDHPELWAELPKLRQQWRDAKKEREMNALNAILADRQKRILADRQKRYERVWHLYRDVGFTTKEIARILGLDQPSVTVILQHHPDYPKWKAKWVSQGRPAGHPTYSGLPEHKRVKSVQPTI